MTQRTIEELDVMHLREIEAIQSGKLRSHRLADRTVHLAVVAQTEHTFLCNAMESIRDLIEWIAYRCYQIRPRILGRFTQDH